MGRRKAVAVIVAIVVLINNSSSVPVKRAAKETEKEGKPYFTSPQKMQRKFVAEPAGENTSVRFHCHAAGSPTPEIEWLKDRRPLDSGNIRYDKVKIKQWTLVLEDLVVSDSGSYTCVIRNKHGSVNATYQLEVIARRFNPPSLKPGLPLDTTAYVGSDVTFRCQVISTDFIAHVQWVRQVANLKEHQLSVDDPFEIVKEGWPTRPDWTCDAMVKNLFKKPPFECIELDFTDGQHPNQEKLDLLNVTVEQSGTYTCLASNAIGIDYRSAELKVKKLPLAPAFTEVLQPNISATVGQDVRIKCPVKGSPRPYITWIKDSKPIVTGQKYLPTRQGLRILNVMFEDNGTYSCNVSNEHGQITGNFTLTVNEEPPVPSYLSDARKVVIMDPEPPYFTSAHKMLANVTKTSGGSVRFRCNAGGSPPPDIKWFKDDHEVNVNDVMAGETRHKKWILALENIHPSDEGLYTCIVSNQYGQINYTYQLIVQPPLILKPGFPRNKSIPIGSPVSFKCDVIATDLQPKIQWLKHVTTVGDVDSGDVITQIKDKWMNQPEWTCDVMIKMLFPRSPPVECIEQPPVLTNDTTTSPEKLHLYDVSDDDSGMYTCLVLNGTLVKAHRSAWLSVIHEVLETTEPIISFESTNTTAEPELTPETAAWKLGTLHFIIIGAVAGVVVTLVLMIVVCCCICRRRRSRDISLSESNGVKESKPVKTQKAKTEKKGKKRKDKKQKENIEMTYEKVSTKGDDEIKETKVDDAINEDNALQNDSGGSVQERNEASNETKENKPQLQDDDVMPTGRKAIAEEETLSSDSDSAEDPMNPESTSEHSIDL